MSEARAAANAILAAKDQLAPVITARLYDAVPSLAERYGERGRQKCLEDMRYNLEHLAPAVALSSPAMFAGYAAWLDDLLRARDVPTADTVTSLELTMDALEETLDPAHLPLIRRCVDAGLSALTARWPQRTPP